MSSNAKLWSGRFSANTAEILEEYNASIVFDYLFYQEDIKGSQAHAKMLAKQGIITEDELKAIITALDEIKAEISKDAESWAKARIADEDIHLAVERELINKIGDLGKKLHTGRSRNDQVVTDLKLYLKDQIIQLRELLKEIKESLIKKAETDIDIILPGYTHLQQAQAISLGHFWLAYFEKFNRDSERLEDCLKRVDINPLGSGALAGTSYNLDREATTKELGFSDMTRNSLDAVSDRDYLLEYEFIISLIMTHLSQLAEEMIIWNSQEFNFITISDGFATGSSMMPQKKNPDIPELLRGKAGRVIGVMNALFITLKGLSLSYNKDLQEDKEQFFMANDTVKKSLRIANDFINNISVNSQRTYELCKNSYMPATDLADYLVKKGMAFRDAYNIVGELVAKAESENKYFTDLSLKDFKTCSDLFEEDILSELSPEACVDKRNVPGGTGRQQVKAAIIKAKELV